MRTTLRFAVAFYLLICVANIGNAQNTNSGDIRGTVTDSSGAVMAGVTVTVSNLDTGATKDIVTNGDGLYDTASILPGSYQLTFTKEGFDKLVRGPITLQVGLITVNGELKVGSTNAVVEVTADVPLLKTESAEQSTTFDSKTLMDLPQVSTTGQNWGSFAQLLPGAAGAPSQPTAGKSGDPGIAIAVNGNLPFYDNFLQDGASTNLPFSSNVDIATFETVSEVQISTSNFSAQYGIGGAVFNQITKSGSNSFHGAGYEYFTADYLQAHPYNFSGVTNPANYKPQPLPFLRYHDLGGAIGGPIFKNKLFFYFNVDKIVNHGSSSGFATVPTLAMRGLGTAHPGVADFSALTGGIYNPATQPAGCAGAACVRTQFAGNLIPANKIDPVALALEKSFPLPNVGGNVTSSGIVSSNYFFTGPQSNPFLKFFGRIDYNVSEKNRINFSITQGDNPAITTNQQICPINCFSGDVDRYNVQISDVYEFSPRTVNEARFGYTKQGNWFIPFSLGKGYPAKAGLLYAKADVFPTLTIKGSSGGVQDFSGLLQPGTNAIYIENTFEPSDIVTMIRGKHILHFGGELLDYSGKKTAWGNIDAGKFTFTGIYTQQNPTKSGAATGSSYADFLLGDVNAWSAGNTPATYPNLRSPQFFVQDDVKLRPNLTVNLGLRYEIQGGWGEKNNLLGSFDPTLPNAKSGTLGAVWFAGETSRTTLQAPVYDIFLPRVGFAWNPGGSTVVRGGFGIYAFTWSIDTYGQGLGFGTGSSGNGNDLTNGALPVTTLSGPGTNLQTAQPLVYVTASRSPTGYNTQNVPYNQYHNPVSKMDQWTLSVERQLGPNMEAEIAYVGSHGSNLDFPVDLNQIPVSKLSPTDTNNDLPYPQFGQLKGTTNNAVSNYNSFQAQIQRRFSGGLSFNANYTWSHFLDSQDSSGWGNRGGSVPYQNAFDPAANYGSSNFDARHAVKGTVVYALPVGRGRQFLNSNRYLDAVVGGWQTSASLLAHSGQPFTVVDTTSFSNAKSGNQYPNVIGDPHLSNPSIHAWYNPAAFSQPANGFGDERRNSLVGPGLLEANFSLGKTFSIREGIGLQFRVDAYNILNHPSFGQPNCGTGSNCSASGVGAGALTNIQATTVGPRAFQLNARVTF